MKTLCHRQTPYPDRTAYGRYFWWHRLPAVSIRRAGEEHCNAESNSVGRRREFSYAGIAVRDENSPNLIWLKDRRQPDPCGLPHPDGASQAQNASTRAGGKRSLLQT
jgi:hypothetical protein